MSNAFWQWGEMRAGRLSTRRQRGNGGQMNPRLKHLEKHNLIVYKKRKNQVIQRNIEWKKAFYDKECATNVWNFNINFCVYYQSYLCDYENA